MPAPATAASTLQPNSAAMDCAAASVSQETRFSLPACCSATTRMVSGIVFYVQPRLHAVADAEEDDAQAGLNDFPDHEEVRAFADVAADKEQDENVEKQKDDADHHQSAAQIFARGFFFFVNFAFVEFHCFASGCSLHSHPGLKPRPTKPLLCRAPLRSRSVSSNHSHFIP